MPLTRLIYVSRRRDGDGDLAAILAASRRANATAGVTGALIVGPDRFLQLLEGRRADVGACLVRIARDPRHDGLEVVSAAEVRHRQFPDWSMEAVEVRDGSAAPHELRPQVELEHLFRRLVVAQAARDGVTSPAGAPR